MSKPKKLRHVQFPPGFLYFRPQEIPLAELQEIVLTLDEYEAIRLIDCDGLDRAQAAQKLGISRATCARIAEAAHGKVARALTEGKAIRIGGGRFTLLHTRYRCLDCRRVWDESQAMEAEGLRPAPEARLAPPGERACPRCSGRRVLDLGREVGHPRAGRKVGRPRGKRRLRPVPEERG